MADPWKTAPDRPVDDEPRVTIEMGGRNIVIRSTAAIDRAYTVALADAVNAASDTDTVVVIDPQPIRCDDAFAAEEIPSSERSCREHVGCRRAGVEVVASSYIRIAAERTTWLIDVGAGRFCQTDRAVDPHFIDPAAWTPVIAICITPTRLRALTTEGTLVTSARAHGPAVAAAS